MDITLEQLLRGKATRIKKNEYAQTEAYVEPFIETLSKLTTDFRCSVKLPDQITFDPESQDITYNRVLIQAVLPEEYCIDNHDEVIGMIYGIDVRKPVLKFYRGGLDRACTNLCIFDPANLSVQEFSPEKAPDYSYLNHLVNSQQSFAEFVTQMKSTIVSYSDYEIERELGKWIRNTMAHQYDNGFSKAKLGVPTIIDAFKLLYEEDESRYFIKEGESTNLYNIYGAFTELISNDNDKDIFNKCEKTLLLKSILDLQLTY